MWHVIAGDKPLSQWKKDGYYTDFDEDGLSDYQEYYLTPPGYGPVTMDYLNSLFQENSEVYNASEEANLSTLGFDESILHLINHTFFFIDDTDNDTLLDGYEVKKGTDPLLQENDEDGLTDKYEEDYYNSFRTILYGFPVVTNGGPYQDFDGDGDYNIVDPDSDGDRFTDGSEFQHGTDPLDYSSRPLPSIIIPIFYYNDWDVNKDNRTNILDLVSVSQHLGETGSPGWLACDVNKDGNISILDMILIAQHWTG